METITIQETQMNQGKKRSLLGILGTLLLILLTCMLIIPLGLGLMGGRIQSTASYLANRRVESIPVPTLDPQSKEAMPGTIIDIWFLRGPRYFGGETIFAQEISRGVTADGQRAIYIAFDEKGLNQYLDYWFIGALTDVVSEVKNPWVDLKFGELELSMDVNLGNQWQRIGLLYELDSMQTQLNFRGFDIDGSLYGTVPDSLLDAGASKLEELSNRALSDLVFIDDDGSYLGISQIYLDEDRAEVLATPTTHRPEHKHYDPSQQAP